jgi:ribosomal protein L37AE/L43A
MPLKEYKLVKFDPWEILDCPFCGSKDFVTIHHASVWCDNCNAQFLIWATGGDYGFVVDAFWEDIWVDRIKDPSMLKFKQISRVVKPRNYDSGWMGFTENEIVYLTEGLPNEILNKYIVVD